MRTKFSRSVLALVLGLVASCTTIPPGFVGDPNTTGFVVVEGEAAIAVQSSNPEKSFWRYSEIQEVTLQSAERPTHTVSGRYRAGFTWFSDLTPGTYRIKDIRLNDERGEATYRLPEDALPESDLTFTIGAGELRYLGFIEISHFKRSVEHGGGAMETSNLVRFNVVHNRDEMRAWEHVYDLYAKTPWEPLLLKKIESLK